ncbi:MAG: hypothetical protein ACJ75P_06785 [Gaiellaceae bacterium]
MAQEIPAQQHQPVTMTPLPRAEPAIPQPTAAPEPPPDEGPTGP